MIYAATMHWYAFPSGTSNRQPELANATAPIPTLQNAKKPPASFPSVIEAELLKVSSSTPGMVIEKQGMQVFGIGMWSAGEQVLGRGTAVGNYLTLELPAPDAKRRKLVAGLTRAVDYATLAFTVNGNAADVAFDGYAKSVSHSGDVVLGTFAPVDGKFQIRVEVSGTNPATTGPRYYFGVDYFRLEEP